MKDYHKADYWKDWYWNKDGRKKVQHSRKVTQVQNYERRKNNRDF